jgi:hypothetical protein
MARKRKTTDIVNLKLRIRETLRKRLEGAAKVQERSLNSEMVVRLEDSFDRAKDAFLLEVLLAPGDKLEFLRAIALVLRMAGAWTKPPQSFAVADAINKLVAVFTGELPAVDDSFPEYQDKTSGDHLAWLAVQSERFHLAFRQQLTGEKQS